MWLEEFLPDEFERLKVTADDNQETGDDEKKRQRRGGKGLMKIKKKEEVVKRVTVAKAARGKKKSVTIVSGLNTFGTRMQIFFNSFMGSFSDSLWLLFPLFKKSI